MTEQGAIVLGGGAIGMAAALVLRSRGVGSILVCELNAGRRAGLEKEGFACWDSAERQPPAASADIVVDAVGGSASRNAASRLVAPGGAIVHIGLLEPEGGLDVRRLTLQEIDFIGSYAYTMLEFRKTVEALVAGVFGELNWTEERPLAEGQRAFDDIRHGRVAAAKIILRP
jgi:threonine dehydrogenase-like Zn-dependent dehydrogenase